MKQKVTIKSVWSQLESSSVKQEHKLIVTAGYFRITQCTIQYIVDGNHYRYSFSDTTPVTYLPMLVGIHTLEDAKKWVENYIMTNLTVDV